METLQDLTLILVSFVVIAIAARQIGHTFAGFSLPLITGFLFAGILTGPFVLGFVSAEAVERLRFIDEISLAFIAFAAGRELYLPELRGRLRSIGWVTGSLLVTTMLFGSVGIYLLGDTIPFMRPLAPSGRFAVALLAGAILVARSPSSAIAVVNELRAKGPFTQMALGVTVIMDVVVVVLFAISSAVADALLTRVSLNGGFVLLLAIELLTAFAAGYLLYQLLQQILATSLDQRIKTGLILTIGYLVFLGSDALREFSHETLPFEILVEPLLVCLIASFLVNNYSRHRVEFGAIVHDVGPYVYVAFFTLTGASLQLDVLLQTWPIALALFGLRVGAIIIGSFTGGVLAGDPMRANRFKWMAFVTQAGLALGLAKEVAVEFTQLDEAFTTMIISVVVLNEMVGPLFFKWAINHLGEAHPRAAPAEFDGIQDALIFGVEGQALALAGQLRAHGWSVKLACLDPTYLPKQKRNGEPPLLPASEDTLTAGDIVLLPELTAAALDDLGARQADAVVTLLSDEENYAICQLIYEHFGTETIVVRLNDPVYWERFHELGALIVDPATAIVGLLDHFVRSPVATSLLLGLEAGQDIIELEVRDPDLAGLALRDLRLPLDTLVLSVQRDGHSLISHGYTRLEMGDRVTVVGSVNSLEEVALQLSE